MELTVFNSVSQFLQAWKSLISLYDVEHSTKSTHSKCGISADRKIIMQLINVFFRQCPCTSWFGDSSMAKKVLQA